MTSFIISSPDSERVNLSFQKPCEFSEHEKYSHLWKEFKNATRNGVEFDLPDVIKIDKQPEDYLVIKKCVKNGYSKIQFLKIDFWVS